ncbi:PAS domain S-box protein [Rhodobacteraceae bacterium KMM 6894]|nr:PAS domain S-box protein [Rhodobacteraceae bacterium KMM 6894]
MTKKKTPKTKPLVHDDVDTSCVESLNEELAALKSQLQQKIETERQLSNDLDNLLASSGIAKILLNRDGDIMRFTPKAQDIFNLINQDIGRPIGDVSGKIDDPTLLDDIAKARDTLVPVQDDVKMKNGDWYNRRILPHGTQDQVFDGMVIAFSDVSELKRYQRQSLWAQHLTQNILNTVHNPLLALDSDMNVVWAGRSFYRLFETTDKNVIGKSLFSVAQGQWNIPELRRNLARVLPDQMPIDSFSLSVETPDKGKRELVLTARKLANEHAETDLILVALKDVTEQKQARQGLLDREARLQAILNAVPEAIITIDTDGIITRFSPPSTGLMGYTQAEVLGQNVSILMPAPYRHKHDSYISAFLETGNAKIIGTGRELEARHKSGKLVPIHLSVSEVMIDDKRQFIGVIRDLTKEKESRKQLEQAQKMEAIGQLTGGIAHDFNNLLTVIIGNIELLEQRPDHPDRAAMLGEALEAANLGEALVSKLLLFSKNRNLAPKRLNLRHVVEDIQPLLLRSLGEQIEIRMDLANDLDLVFADPGQIETAVLNLAINARDAMPHGGTLTLAARQLIHDGDKAQTNLNDLAPGRYVVLSVADTGIGMTPKVLDRAFEPFFTTKDVGKGSGLGLSMIYGWVRQYGGNLILSSKTHEGTVASLYLPTVTAEEIGLPAPVSLSDTPVSHRGGAVILLVEDDPRVLNLTRSRLEHLGYSVIEATDGPAALKQLEKHKNISLMLSDVVMPHGIDGIELANKANALYPELKIILATGYAPKAENVIWPVLRKPYGIETLADALDKALGGSV